MSRYLATVWPLIPKPATSCAAVQHLALIVSEHLPKAVKLSRLEFGAA